MTAACTLPCERACLTWISLTTYGRQAFFSCRIGTEPIREQLELAFDLGLIPIITDVGFFEEQWEMLENYIQRPFFVNWSDGNEEKYGQRFLWAMLEAIDRSSPSNERRAEFHEFRRKEHGAVLDSYSEVYIRSQETTRG